MGERDVRFIAEALREGHLGRKNQVPSHHDKDGRAVYRVLLRGLRWQKVRAGRYEAADGPGRTWIVESGRRGWTARLADDEFGPYPVLPTMGEAREHAEHEARRMPWIEGAPW